MEGREVSVAMKNWMYASLMVALALALEVGAAPPATPPAGPVPQTIADWLTIGPFPAGTREGLVDELMEYGGLEKIQPKEGMELSSFYAKDGVVRWTKTQSKEGKVTLDNKDVDWDALSSQWGAAGGASGWFGYAEYTSDADRSVLISAEKIGGFLINGERYYGDPYGNGYVLVPAIFHQGLNRILVRVGGGGPTAFTFSWVPSPAPLIVSTKDALLPDLILDQKMEGWAGIPVVNTTAETINGAKLVFGGKGLFAKSEVAVPELPPLSTLKVPILMKTTREVRDSDETSEGTLDTTIAVTNPGAHSGPLSFRVRKPGESYHVTFRSKTDLSVQKYAVLPPTNFDSRKTYALIVAAHGASVDSDGMPGAYTPKDWAVLIAPTNTRPFGFDWQDWGRLNLLESIDLAKQRFHIDENRVYLVGHSMGAHGTWYNAMASADQFAAFGPSAGWTSFEYYVPFTLRRSNLYMSPTLKSIWDRAMREDDVPLYIENAHNLPGYVIQGGKDDDVAPFHARWMVSLMRDLGQEAVYYERPGAPHWWTDPKIPGSACVNWPELMDFLQTKVRNPKPKDVILRTNDIALNNHAYWVTIDQMDVLYEDTRVEAHVHDDGSVWIDAQNVAQLSLDLKGIAKPGDVCVGINGSVVCGKWDGASPLVFHKSGDGFLPGPADVPPLHKSPTLFGPMKRALFSPFMFVYGTTGGPEMTHQTQRAAVLDSQIWWWRANGYAPVIPDSEVTPDIEQNYNLVLYGGPEANSVTARLDPNLPIHVTHAGVTIGTHTHTGPGLAARFVYPNLGETSPIKMAETLKIESELKAAVWPRASTEASAVPLYVSPVPRLVLVIAGTDPAGMRLAQQANLMYSGAGYPDFIVFDATVKTEAWGGFLAAGFFDNAWQLPADPRLAFFR